MSSSESHIVRVHTLFFLTDEVRVIAVVKNGGLEWSVKIRRVRLIRCVFRCGRWDGMGWDDVRTRADELAGQER